MDGGYEVVSPAKNALPEGHNEYPRDVHEDRKRRALTSMYAKRCFFRYSFDLLLIMSELEGVLLNFLINEEVLIGDKVRDGWFYCTIERMQQFLYMDARKQQRQLKRLKARGYVETKPIGDPAKRGVKINYYQIMRDIDDAKNKLLEKGQNQPVWQDSSVLSDGEH